MGVGAAGTHPSRAQPSSFKPGAVGVVEELATGAHPPVVREVLVGAPAGCLGCAWEAADSEAEKGQPRSAREVQRVGAVAQGIREGLELPP